MRLRHAAVGSALFFALAPGVVAGVLPWWLTRWRMSPAPLAVRIAGAVLVLVAVPSLARLFVRFVRDGLGTPAPVAPTELLVTTGAYRYVRNPMYLAVLSAILGQALLLGQPVLLAYAAGVAVMFVIWVRFDEEPVLRQQFGAEYDAYRRAGPAWWPRRRPWTGESDPAGTSFPIMQQPRVEPRTYTLAAAAAVLGNSEARVLQLVEAGLPERASRLRRP